MRTTVIILLLGLGLLLGGRFAAPDMAGPVAAFVPPWQQGGLARAAELGLPVVDIRWNGRLLVLDAGAGADRLAGQGLWIMDAEGAGACAADPQILTKG